MAHARPFLTGVVGGGLLAAVLFWTMGPTAGRAEAAPLTVVEPAGSREAELASEVDRLRAELAKAEIRREPSAGGAEAATPASQPATPVAEGLERGNLLLAEYDDARRLGALLRWLQQEPMSGAAFLVQLWMAAGAPERAVDILARIDLEGQGGDLAYWAGTALREKGNVAGATRAFLLALRESPGDWDPLTALADLDPEAALRELEAMTAARGDDADFRAQSALLLLASGKTEEGLRLVDSLLGEGSLHDSVWEHLIEHEPAAAEARLRQSIEAGAGDVEAQRRRLVLALQGQGKTEAALQELESLLAEEPDNTWNIERYGELAPQRALAWFEERLRTEPSPTLYGMYGEQLLQAGRTEEGIGALWRAWEAEPDGDYGLRLMELMPERVAPRLLQRAASTRDDELYGDIADTYWKLGRRQEAKTWWERALQLDPTDSEWIDKVRAVAQGRDPMQ